MDVANYYRNLSHADLHRVTSICERLHHADPTESFLQQCHDILGNVVSCIHASAEIYSVDPFALSSVVNPTVDQYWMNVFNQYVLDHPYAARMQGDEKSHLEAIQFEPTLKEFKTTSLYNEFYTKVQGQNQLWLAHRDNNEMLSFIYLRESEYSDEASVTM